MTSIYSKKINDVRVTSAPRTKPADNRPVLGWKLFPGNSCNTNSLFVAKRKSGKSTVIYKSIDQCADKDTKIIIICSSIDNDPTWISIQELCKKKKIDLTMHTSIFDEDGDNVLEILMKKLARLREGEEQSDNDDDNEDNDDDLQSLGLPGSDDWMASWGRGETLRPQGGVGDITKKRTTPRKPKKSKFQAPKYLIVLDDIPNELKNTWVTVCLKAMRHWGKMIVSTQSINDIVPGGRNQFDYVLLFKGMPIKKIEDVHKGCALDITFEQMMEMYRFATEKKFNFLWISAFENEYRKNFDEEIVIPTV